MAKLKRVRGRATKLKDVLECRPKLELPEYQVMRITGIDPSDDEDYEDDPQYMYGDMTYSLGWYKTEEEALQKIKDDGKYNQCTYRITKTHKQFRSIQADPILQEINE